MLRRTHLLHITGSNMPSTPRTMVAAQWHPPHKISLKHISFNGLLLLLLLLFTASHLTEQRNFLKITSLLALRGVRVPPPPPSPRSECDRCSRVSCQIFLNGNANILSIRNMCNIFLLHFRFRHTSTPFAAIMLPPPFIQLDGSREHIDVLYGFSRVLYM